MTSERQCDFRQPRRWLPAGVAALLLVIVLLTISLLLLRYDPPDPDANVPLALLAPTSLWSSRCPRAPQNGDRFECYPEDLSVVEKMCTARGCCWNDSFAAGPRCFYPSNYGYRTSGQANYSSNRMDIPLLRLPSPSRFGDDIQHVYVQLETQTPYRLHLKILDADNKRYQVRTPKIPEDPDPSLTQGGIPPLYSVSYSASPFSVQVRRDRSGTLVFDTSVGGLTISHQFLQMSTRLPSAHVYGLGQQTHPHFRHDLNWRTWGMFSQGASPQGPHNLNGVHPFYVCLENNGNAHGVLLLNSNAAEVQLQPTPALTFRTIGGVLDLYIFLGPTPEDVVRQYSEAVGRPVLPPYWALGFHFGRTDYLNAGQVQQDVDKLKQKDFPLDVLHLGTAYTKDGATFYLDDDRFGNLKRMGPRYVVSVEPAISTEQPVSRYPTYHLGLHHGVFVNSSWGHSPLVVQSFSGPVVYPDFGGPTTGPWWSGAFLELHQKLPYDGIVMTRNEPTTQTRDDCQADNLNRPPYLPRVEGLPSGTLCMDATHYRKERHYDVHNTYGLAMTIATDQATRLIYGPRRSFLMSSSTFPGSGRYAGHWLSFGSSTWDQLASSVAAVLESGLFGIPLVGISVCSEKETSEELCLRSIQLGSFYPVCLLCREDVDDFSEEFMEIVRHTLHRRYELLPFLYTLFYLSHTLGSTVVRPLHHEFLEDNATYSVDSQFLWGPALMVTPALRKGQTTVSAYFPPGRWFDYYTGQEVAGDIGHWQDLDAPLYTGHKPVNLHVRGGHVIPTQRPAGSTDQSRRNPMQLTVALDSRQSAAGSLFWDDGQTRDTQLLGANVMVTFQVTQSKLEVSGRLGNKEFGSDFYRPSIQHVRILGLPSSPSEVAIDDGYILTDRQFHWDSKNKVLHLQNIIVPLDRRTSVKWSL